MRSPYSKEVYERNADIYRLLANPLRLEILNVLAKQEMCVDSLSRLLGRHKANISQ